LGINNKKTAIIRKKAVLFCRIIGVGLTNDPFTINLCKMPVRQW